MKLALLLSAISIAGAAELANTPLMEAALYSSAAEMRALIGKGADVNATNAAGATALMTAIGDLEKVRLLVEHGANVNAVSAAGNTPVGLASRLPAGGETVRFLLSKGAKPTAGVLRAAIRRGDLEMARHIRDAGVKDGAASVMAALDSGKIEMLTFALPFAGNLAEAEKGVRTTALMRAAYSGWFESAKLLIAKGADIEAHDNRGRTPLMYAVAAPRPNLELIRLLVKSGASKEAKDVRGYAARDWAGLRAFAPAIQEIGGQAKLALPPPARASENIPPVREQLLKSLEVLDKAGPAFFKANACISCHNQSIPQMAYGRLKELGIEADAAGARSHGKTVLGVWSGHASESWQSSCAVGGGGVATMSYGLMGLAAIGQPRTPVIDSVVHCLLIVQQPDGSWNLPDLREPLGVSVEKYTALSLRGIQQYRLPGRSAEIDERLARARRFLENSRPGDTQAAAMKLLGLRWSGAGEEQLRTLAGELAALQAADGGWPQRAELASDAYATGQALWALTEGAGWKSDHPVYQRGASFLRRTQLPDGSWFVHSRGFGFQPYRETGFPHGHDQWISAAATGFAIMGLAPAVR